MKKSTGHDSILWPHAELFFTPQKSLLFLKGIAVLQLQAYLITFRSWLDTLEILNILAHVSNAVRKTLSRNIRGFFASFPPIFVSFGNPPSHVFRGGTEGGNGKYLEILFSLGVDGGLLSLNTFLGGEGGC